jgi:hypothetical protein
MVKKSIYFKIIIIFLVALGITFTFKGTETNLTIRTLVSVATFIFGITIGFAITNSYGRLNAIRGSLRKQDALIIEIHQISKNFSQKIQEEIKQKLDSILTNQIDYKIQDFNKSPKKTLAFYSYLLNLKTKNSKEENAKKELISKVSGMVSKQKEVSHHSMLGLGSYQWASLIVLATIIIFYIYYTKEENVISFVIISLLSTSLILLLLVLRELDTLNWEEEDWIWDPLSVLFLELNLKPYFPEQIFNSGRINKKILKRFNKARIAHYPNPYPDMSGKKVKEINL